ncbi:MAG: shikimate dehydrogenase [Proteobacteria bacterium]|nr:shikimate dehydrogenase [Pseudomonadota bacterium]HQR03841.1 shikimate dehydrogenase [Rhodocyclaceae bacterium]
MTDHYAVTGNPIAHSRSPTIHTLFAAQTGQDLRYDALLAPFDGFATTVRDFAATGGRGMNVTVPFKEEAYRLATVLTPRAQAAGAVNTLSFEGADIRGDNTDGAGLVRDLVHNLGCPVEGRRVLLLGAGGAARGVIQPLLEHRPARLLIANRTAHKAAALAGVFPGTTACDLPALQESEMAFDIVINATSSGLSDEALPLSAGIFAAGALAYEMVYGKATPFLRLAAAAEVRGVDGLGMLVEQAAEAFFVWRGVRPDTGPVLRQLRPGSA